MIYSINKPERRAGINAECIFGGRRGLGATRPGRGCEPLRGTGAGEAQTAFDGAHFLPGFFFWGERGAKENKGLVDLVAGTW